MGNSDNLLWVPGHDLPICKNRYILYTYFDIAIFFKIQKNIPIIKNYKDNVFIKKI